MNKSDFHYHLPPELIAQQPLAARGGSRMLIMDRQTGKLQDSRFSQFIDLLHPNDLLTFNDTKVIPARLFAHKQSGGKVEILIERLEGQQALAHIKASKTPKPGAELILEHGHTCQVIEREQDLFRLRFPDQPPLLQLLDQIGHIPLPPYIQRADDDADQQRYQTVYAKHAGAVAAPTAGLHFDPDLLQAIAAKGVASAYVTLHVGAGTFQPVRTENLAEHIMHQEYYQVPPATVDAIRRARAQGGRVVAVGTTAVRALESAAGGGEIQAAQGETRLFITPGYRFNCVDALLTNFHLPESTLLMLISAFAGHAPIMQAYQHAIEQRYRFFSYGDAMAIF